MWQQPSTTTISSFSCVMCSLFSFFPIIGIQQYLQGFYAKVLGFGPQNYSAQLFKSTLYSSNITGTHKIPRDFTIKKLCIHISNNHIKHTLERIKSIDEQHDDNAKNNNGKHYKNTTLQREKKRERDKRGDNTGQGWYRNPAVRVCTIPPPCHG